MSAFRKVIFALITVLFTGVPAFAEENFGIFTGVGAGFANNLQFIDRLNALEKVHKETPVLTDPSVVEKEPLAYAGISFEGRYYVNNVVYGLGIGYYNLAEGKRTVSGMNSGNHYVYIDRIDMELLNLAASVYYNVKFENENYLLLGGGLLFNSGTYNETVSLDVNKTEVAAAGYEKTLSKTAIGWQMGLEYNFTFGMINISLGAITRFADIYNYKIEYTSTVDNRASGGFTGCYLYTAAGIRF